jgi:hypothetical protein
LLPVCVTVKVKVRLVELRDVTYPSNAVAVLDNAAGLLIHWLNVTLRQGVGESA